MFFHGDKITLSLFAGYENVVENKDFLIKGIKHDSAVAGGWKGKVSANPFLLENRMHRSHNQQTCLLMCAFRHRISC